MKTLTLKVKSVYGNNLTYPSCDNSIILSNFLGKKTFDDKAIKCLKQLGYEVNIIPL